MTEPRSPVFIHVKGDRRPGRGPRMLITAGILAVMVVLAADAWMPDRPPAAVPTALTVVLLAGITAVLAGAAALRAARQRNRRSRR